MRIRVMKLIGLHFTVTLVLYKKAVQSKLYRRTINFMSYVPVALWYFTNAVNLKM